MACTEELEHICRNGKAHTAVRLLLNCVGSKDKDTVKKDVQVRGSGNLRPQQADFEAEHDGEKFGELVAAVVGLLKPKASGPKAKATTEVEFLAKYMAVAPTAVQWESLDRPTCWLAVMLRLKGTNGPWAPGGMSEDDWEAYRTAVLEHGVLDNRFVP